MTIRDRIRFSWRHFWQGFWLGLPLALVRGLLYGAMLFAMVVLLGSIQNGLIWDHISPESFNDWASLGIAGIAGCYGFYQGVTGPISGY